MKLKFTENSLQLESTSYTAFSEKSHNTANQSAVETPPPNILRGASICAALIACLTLLKLIFAGFTTVIFVALVLVVLIFPTALLAYGEWAKSRALKEQRLLETYRQSWSAINGQAVNAIRHKGKTTRAESKRFSEAR